MQKVLLRKHDKLDFRANEAFKTLRTNILFSGHDTRVITLTSSTPNEGKSSLSFQLAVSFAEADNRVLFIDADIRKSVLVGRYKAEGNKFGLTHYLSGQKTIDDVICNTDINNMDMIFAGPVSPNPTELLSGGLFADLIGMAREEYDYVIIDAPPLSGREAGDPGAGFLRRFGAIEVGQAAHRQVIAAIQAQRLLVIALRRRRLFARRRDVPQSQHGITVGAIDPLRLGIIVLRLRKLAGLQGVIPLLDQQPVTVGLQQAVPFAAVRAVGVHGNRFIELRHCPRAITAPKSCFALPAITDQTALYS